MPKTPLEPERLEAALAACSASRVEVRETHISWVFLTDERAYKLKKPLVLPFLDYGTPARRRRMCQAEVRLNRRLAPDLYLGVRAVVQKGDEVELGDEKASGALDYVVEMRRYEEGNTMAAMLDRGELTRRQLVEVAHTLAAFHSKCRAARRGQRGAEAVEGRVARNVDELLGVAQTRAERKRILTVARFTEAFVSSHAPQFDERAASGRIRECHGDLRAEHVLLRPAVSIVDCVEFDSELRTLDVADDLAFLFMDLTALGGNRFAEQLVAAYREAGGDCGDDALLSCFAAHRALVRAKVLLVRAAQHPAGSAAHGHASAQARELLSVAERFAWRARLPLAIVVCGAPATGKSYLARALAAASGLPPVSSDVVRKRLAGIGPTERASPQHYRDEFNRATYAELGRRAAAELNEHGGVLVDATFRHRRDREAFAAAFAGAAPLLFVECVAPAQVVARRAAQRQRTSERVSDATPEVALRERLAWEPLDEIPPQAHVTLRTDRDADDVVSELLGLMDRRLSETGHACDT